MYLPKSSYRMLKQLQVWKNLHSYDKTIKNGQILFVVLNLLVS